MNSEYNRQIQREIKSWVCIRTVRRHGLDCYLVICREVELACFLSRNGALDFISRKFG